MVNEESQMIQQCVKVSKQIEFKEFVCNTNITAFNVLPEDIRSHVEYDEQVEALGCTWVLLKDGRMVAAYDEVLMTLAVR